MKKIKETKYSLEKQINNLIEFEWMRADSSNIIWVIEDYLRDYPESSYRSDAEKKLELLLNNAGINKREDFVVCKSVQSTWIV